MQVSLADNLHETSDLIFYGKYEKQFKMSSAEMFTQHVKQGAESADDNSMIFFLFFTENRLWNFIFN